MASEQVRIADSSGMIADLKSIAARSNLNVSIERKGDTARGGWVYVEISGSQADVYAMVALMT